MEYHLRGLSVKNLKLFVTAFLTMVTLFVLVAQPANAFDPQSPAEERYTSVAIFPEHSAIKPGEDIRIATTVKLAPHWHVYWSNPGDSGLPVKIDWKLPEGFEISEIKWPVPDKISYDILVNYGYYDSVTLIQTLTVPDTLPEGKIDLEAQLDLLVCNEICIPESDTIIVHLNNPDNLDTDHAELINKAEQKLPKTIKGQFFFHEANDRLHLSLTPEDRNVLNGATSDNTDFFPHDWGIINHAALPDAVVQDGNVVIKHERGDQPIKDLEHVQGLFVIKGEIGQNVGYIISAKPAENSAAPVSVNKGNAPAVKQNNLIPDLIDTKPDNSVTWLSALYLALLGGMVLNLMPCVFPVLSMKVLSLVKMKDKENTQARLHGITYTLGVVLSFLIVGATLIILKEAGAAIGWGFQLQNPIIVAALAYLLFAVGLNLMGFFEFGNRLGNVGNKLTQGQSYGSSFFTGVLATIVATPCTAPFMGVAMGFAITQPAIVSLSVFATLGFGLALPYLFLAFVPAARHLLPRPGAWMNTFKQFLAFPMFASAIWLIWVLSQQAGPEGVLWALLGLLAIAFSVWLYYLENRGIARALSHLALVISLLLMTFTLTSLKNVRTDMSTKDYVMGVAYDKEGLSALLLGNDPVFVEMTAAWCITCKINHAAAINIDSTKKLFQDKNVQYMIGDWTNQDSMITEYLDSFGRNGVPLYVYYGKRDPMTQMRPEAEVLPQVLTPSIVKEVIGK